MNDLRLLLGEVRLLRLKAVQADHFDLRYIDGAVAVCDHLEELIEEIIDKKENR